MLSQTIRHYRVIGTLGVGGMGVVYEAEDTRLSRRVALKFLPESLADDPDASRRFECEAQTIAGLSNPKICTVYDIDDHQGRRFAPSENARRRMVGEFGPETVEHIPRDIEPRCGAKQIRFERMHFRANRLSNLRQIERLRSPTWPKSDPTERLKMRRAAARLARKTCGGLSSEYAR